jgi:hypothetical protein
MHRSHESVARKHTLIYSEQCPNCIRFLDALRRTSIHPQVATVDVHTLSNDIVDRLAAVPALVDGDSGATMYGTKAFEWLKQFEGDVELDAFSSDRGALAFSDWSSSHGYASCAEQYGPFEAMGEQ